MRLKYKVLWIENDSDWLDSVEGGIKTIIENEHSLIYECRNLKQKENDIVYNEYDLILMDLNLDGEPTGDKLIQEIRENGIYTDVVFYSAGGLETIKEKARELDLEGVYFSGRDKIQFTKKVGKVIETTIKKVEDLNNLRGLVMAEVSELDAIMDDIILKYFTTSKRMELFHNKITKDRENSLHKQLNNPGNCNKQCLWNIRGLEIDKIVSVIDSSQKAHAVHELLKDINSDRHLRTDNGSFLSTYTDEIITVRNNLAHCESKVVGIKEVLCTREGNISFDAENFRQIRSNITKYNKFFSDILQEV